MAPEFWKWLQLWAAGMWAEKSLVRRGDVAVASGEMKGLACTCVSEIPYPDWQDGQVMSCQTSPASQDPVSLFWFGSEMPLTGSCFECLFSQLVALYLGGCDSWGWVESGWQKQVIRGSQPYTWLCHDFCCLVSYHLNSVSHVLRHAT